MAPDGASEELIEEFLDAQDLYRDIVLADAGGIPLRELGDSYIDLSAFDKLTGTKTRPARERRAAAIKVLRSSGVVIELKVTPPSGGRNETVFKVASETE